MEISATLRWSKLSSCQVSIGRDFHEWAARTKKAHRSPGAVGLSFGLCTLRTFLPDRSGSSCAAAPEHPRRLVRDLFLRFLHLRLRVGVSRFRA